MSHLSLYIGPILGLIGERVELIFPCIALLVIDKLRLVSSWLQ